MTYTNEEREIIKNKIKMIDDYCKTEIAPLINSGHICADVSETKYRKDGSAYKKTYEFYVNSDGTSIFIIGIATYSISGSDETNSWAYNIYDYLYTMEELLLKWHTVKTKLLDEIHKEEQKKSAILDFRI